MKQSKFKETEIGKVPEEWDVKEIGDVCHLVRDSFSPSREDSRAYIGLEHIEQDTLRLISIGSSKNINSNKLVFRKGQILFGKLRPYFRKVYRPNFEGVCSTDIFVIDANKKFDNCFLFYFFADRRMIEEAKLSSEGTRMPRASWKYLEKLQRGFPDLSEQKAIAKILSDLDSKIELNNEINKTLEAIGQALFKHWFVDFEFPNGEGKPYKSSGGEMVESELGEMPKGWKAGKLGEIIENFDSKRIPLSSREREKRQGQYPYHGAAGVMDFIDDYIFDGEYLLMGEDGTVTDSNGFPILQYVWGKFWVNNHAHIIRGKEGIPLIYLLLLLKNTNVSHIVTGAVQPKINQRNMNSVEIIIPDKKTLSNFNHITSVLYSLFKNNTEENNSLVAIRDSLLPRLMSGRIRVSLG